MKKLLLAVFLILLSLTVLFACGEQDNGNIKDAIELTEDLSGWFDYGSALYHRDEFTAYENDSFAISMAKNEKEGFQYILASTQNYDDLRCEVSTLTDGNGNSLEGTVYVAWNVYIKKADFNHLRGYTPDALLEQDNPYQGGTFDVVANRSKTLYVQYVTTKDTVPGTYTGKLEIKQGDSVLLEGDVSVTVWNIYYDEKTECLSLYQYGYDPNDAGAGGAGPANAPDFTNNWELSQQYVDFMLDNRLSPWHLPFEGGVLSELAPKYMDNPRLTLTYITDLPNPGLQYEKAVETGWIDKLVVMTYDEPNMEEHVQKIEYNAHMFNRSFPTTMHLNPFGDVKLLKHMDWLERFTAVTSIHCPNSHYFREEYNAVNEYLYNLQSEKGDTLLWYVCGWELEGLINLLPCSPGTEKRVLFWQQYENNIEGFLYFQTTRWNRFDDIWEEGYEDKRHKPAASLDGPTGDGLLIYWDPITDAPVGGLGMESVRDGMEDFQLMRMAEAVLGKDAVMAYVHRITTSVTEFTSDAELLNQVKCELAEALLSATAQ